MVKRCFCCGIEKDLNDFYKHKQMADGHLNKCKKCVVDYSSKRYNILFSNNPKFVENERKRGRDKYKKYHYKSSSTKNESIKKVRARTSHIVALNKEEELHHWSYDLKNANDFICLSIRDHRKLHKHLLYDEAIKAFKTKCGLILDTKEKHIEFIKSLQLQILTLKTKNR